jgi:hypothetical protein
MRTPTLATRKPIDAFTMRDLEVFPVWEYAIDDEDHHGQDETWVRPMDTRFVPRGRWSMLVSTTFALKSGGRLAGFSVVTTSKPLEIQAGALLLGGRYIVLPSVQLERPGRDDLVQMFASIGAALGRGHSAVLSVQWALGVPIGKERVVRGGTLTLGE